MGKRAMLVAGVTLALAVNGCMNGSMDRAADGGEQLNTYDPSNRGADASAGLDWAEGERMDTDQCEGPHCEPSNDQYEDVGTNPYTRADHDPFSTFAADVDTASYDIFVRDIGYNSLPDRRSVRLEEYVNFFDYDYDAPAHGAEIPFTIDLMATAHPLGRDVVQLRVGIQAAEPPEHEKRPTNLVFLIDVSGSMTSSDKLPLVQQLLLETLNVLDATDTISVVTYASDTGVRLSPTPMTERATIEAIIDGLAAGGSTAGASGINLAYEQAEAAYIEDGFNHVILCTDGDFNVGTSNTDELVELIEEKRETGITLTTLGFGRGNLNDAMMERVSNAGNGIYSVIANEDHATRYAQEDILRTVNHVAKDMKIQLELNPEYVLAYRLLGYENRAIADEDFRNDVVDAGEVGSGHRVTALYELVLTGGTIPSPEAAPPLEEGAPVEGDREIDAAELVRVKVRWKEIDATEDDPASEIVAALTPDQVMTETADPDFLWVSAIAAFAEILKQSPFGDVAHLDRIAEIAEAQADRDRDRQEFFDLFQIALPLIHARPTQ